MWTNTPVCNDPQPLMQTLYQYAARPDYTYPWGLSQKAVPRFGPEIVLTGLVAGYRREHAAAGEPARLLLGSGDLMSRILQPRRHSQKLPAASAAVQQDENRLHDSIFYELVSRAGRLFKTKPQVAGARL